MRKFIVLFAACLFVLSASLNAASLDDLVESGDTALHRDGSHLTITVGSRCTIDYSSFDLRDGETIRFIQPGKDAEVVLRIADSGSPSLVNGEISANGKIVLNDPAGITLGEKAVIKGSGIVLDGGEEGTVKVAGELDASNRTSGETGEAVTVLGRKVVLDGKANIDVSGLNGGGTVLIGGDYQGNNTDIRNALYTTVSRGVSIKADALGNGNGGRVILWADKTTEFYGKISARGGMQEGDGGFVEVSGKINLIYRGSVDTRAPEGKTGMLLLDPADITISDGTGDGAADGTDTFSGDPSGTIGSVAESDSAPTTIYESELEGLSSTTSISLQATNNLTIGNLSDNTLSLQAAAGQTVEFIADSDYGDTGDFSMNSGDTIVTQGADVRFEGENITTGGITTNGGNVELVPDLDFDFIGGGSVNGAVNTGGGDFTMNYGESFSSSGSISTGDGLVTVIVDGAGTLSLGAAVNAGTGSVELECVADSVTLGGITAGNLTVTSSGTISHSGTLTVTGTASFTVTAADSDILLASAANDFDNSVLLFTSGSGSVRDLAFRNVDLVGGITIPSGLNDLTLIYDNTGITMPATTLTGNLTLTAGGSIIDSGNLIVPGTTTLDAGSNDITLNNSNDFGTVIVAAAGNVILNDINAIALGSMTTVGGQDITGTVITLDGTSYDSDDGNITFNSPVILGANASIDSDADNDGTDGDISFSGEVNGDFSLSLDADTGNVLLIDDAGGTTPLAALTVVSAAQVDMASVNTAGALDITGTNIDLNSGDYQSSAGGLSFTGDVDLDAGAVTVAITSGGGAGDDISFSGAIDDAAGNTALALEAGASGIVTLAGAIGGTSPIGALTVDAGGGIDLTGGITTSDGTLTFNDPVELQADFAIDSGTGDVTFNGAVTSSTMAWTVTFSDNGTVSVNANAIMNMDGGTGDDHFVFGSGVTLTGTLDGGAGSDTLDYSSFSTGRTVALTGTGSTDGFAGTETSITGGFDNINVLTGSGTSTDSLTGIDAAASWSIDGTNTYTSTNTLSFSGIDSLAGGSGADVFDLTGSLAGTLTLGNNDLLQGNGTVAGGFTAASGSTVAPGASPDIINSGNVSFTSGSTYSVELNGTTPGSSGHDQLNVTGTVSLSGSTLDVTLGFTPSPGDEFIIIANDGADAVTGNFSGLAEGAVVNTLIISYVGGDGNDVVLTATDPPVVTTQAASSVTTTTATGNGTITDLGGSAVTQHGVCWSTSANPTTSDSKTTEGAAAATGAFTSGITGLSAGTTYHYRAYATNSDGTSYGADVTFTTDPLAPTVTTQAVTGILGDAATGHGNITDLGVPDPTAHGVCWNTTGTPTLADDSADEGAASATGAFTSNMTGLTGGTMYYVRAYATNTAGTAYGNEVSFTTLASYTVTYSANGADSGTAPASQNKTEGVNLTLASNTGSLGKTGFEFAGWNTAADGSGTDYAEGATYTTDAALSLYAKWSPVLVVSISDDTVYEDGLLSTATVARFDGTTGDLTVTLSSDDVPSATVPASVIIPDGSSSVGFDVTIVDNGAADGARTVTVTATAAGYGDGTDIINILDDEFSDPTSISGCELWLDADDLDGDGAAEGTAAETGVTGGNINTWTDKSGMNNDAVQGTAAEQALLVDAAADGRAVVRFDGTDDYFSFTEITTIRTVFLVIKENKDANGTSPLLGHSSLSHFARGSAKNIWDGVNTHANILTGDTYLDGESVDGTATALPAGSFRVVSLITAGNVSADQLTRDQAIAGTCWNGDIAEVIIYSSVLSDADRIQVETYLTDRWPTGGTSGGGGGGGGGCTPGSSGSLPAVFLLAVFGTGLLWYRKR